MHRLFGKKKDPGPPPPTLADASTSVGNRVGALDEKIAALDKELIKYKNQLKQTPAGAAQAGIKRRAMETLKRKKMYEQQRDMVSAQQFNLDSTAFMMESVKDTQNVVAALKAASVQVKAEHKKIDINQIEDMQDDLEDMFEDMNEINEIMGRTYGVPDGIDEDELDAELAGLEEEFESTSLTEAAPAVKTQNAAQVPKQQQSLPAFPMPSAGQMDFPQPASAQSTSTAIQR